MIHIKVTIREMQLASQLVKGGADEHMVARAIITIENNRERIDTYTDLKETPGGSFAPGDIEVGMPANYRGPFRYQVFRDEIARYYCSLVGESGQIFNIGPDAHNIGLEGITMKSATPYSFEFDVPE